MPQQFYYQQKNNKNDLNMTYQDGFLTQETPGKVWR